MISRLSKIIFIKKMSNYGREKHSSQNGACIDCGLKDNTTTGGKDIPFTGEKTFIWIPITVLALLTVYGAVELRKYKNVK